MRQISRIASAGALLLVVTASAVEAQGRGDGKGKAGGQRAEARTGVVGRVAGGATDAEIRIIRRYYAEHREAVKPLPPGIAKNLARGKPLPPGIARTRVPDGLLRQLPRRDGADWIRQGDAVILVNAAGLVLDVLRDIL